MGFPTFGIPAFGIPLLTFSLLISEDLGVFVSFSAIAAFLFPLANVLKILRSLGEERKIPKSSLISKETVTSP